MNQQYYLLACNRINGLGPRRIAQCMEVWPDLGDMFQASTVDLLQAGLPEKIVQSIKTFDFSEVEADLNWLKQSNHHILSWGSPQYPPLLMEIYDPPPILYAKGNVSCLEQIALAIVGSRKPSVMGCETAWQFAYELAQPNVTIVSGLAMGIDAQAHSGCLAANGLTVAVMGTGIDIIYPYRHQALAQQISESGLLLSEFPLKSQPNAGHFPRRNRIISGLSCATLVVEAAVRSGSLITAKFAMEQNRDVFAIPGSIHHPQAQGCHRLLQQGATLITSPDELKNELQLSKDRFLKNIPIPSKVCDNHSLLQYIGFEATTIDQIISRSGLFLDDILCGVAELEIQGCVQIVPGGYMRCQ